MFMKMLKSFTNPELEPMIQKIKIKTERDLGQLLEIERSGKELSANQKSERRLLTNTMKEIKVLEAHARFDRWLIVISIPVAIVALVIFIIF